MAFNQSDSNPENQIRARTRTLEPESDSRQNQNPTNSPSAVLEPKPKKGSPLIILNYGEKSRQPFSESSRQSPRRAGRATPATCKWVGLEWNQLGWVRLGWGGAGELGGYTTQLGVRKSSSASRNNSHRVSQNKIKIKAKFNLSKIDYRPIMCSLRAYRTPHTVAIRQQGVLFLPSRTIHLCLAIRQDFIFFFLYICQLV